MSERLLLALVVVTSLAACNAGNSQELQGCGAVVSAYFGKAPRETIEVFTRSDLETKYRIYLCGSQVVHPPALYLAESFADGGERVATFLHQKLAETRSDATVRDVMQVFAEMQRQGTYDVNGDLQLMNLLGDRVEAIRDEYWREYCADILALIRSSSR